MKPLVDMYYDIPIGKENSICKNDLIRLWGVSERKVRTNIQELRATDFGDDYVIVSLSTGKGYYKTSNIGEIINFKREVSNRAKNTFLPLKKVNRILQSQGLDQQLSICVNNLKKAREEAGLQAKDVVEIISEVDSTFDKAIMSKIENNKCFPNKMQLEIMTKLYGKTPMELVGIEIY